MVVGSEEAPALGHNVPSEAATMSSRPEVVTPVGGELLCGEWLAAPAPAIPVQQKLAAPEPTHLWPPDTALQRYCV